MAGKKLSSRSASLLFILDVGAPGAYWIYSVNHDAEVVAAAKYKTVKGDPFANATPSPPAAMPQPSPPSPAATPLATVSPPALTPSPAPVLDGGDAFSAPSSLPPAMENMVQTSQSTSNETPRSAPDKPRCPASVADGWVYTVDEESESLKDIAYRFGRESAWRELIKVNRLPATAIELKRGESICIDFGAGDL